MPVLAEDDVVELGVEADFAAGLLDLLAQAAHHAHELVGADVRLGLPEDLLGRARVDEPLQHVPRERALRARSQLAVGKRARAALAELHVRRQVEVGAVVERVDRARALVHVAAALDHERAQSGPREVKRREQTRRPRPHDDRPRRAFRQLDARDLQRRGGNVLLDLHALGRLQVGRVRRAPTLDRKRRDEAHAPLTRIDAALYQLDVADVGRLQPERVGSRRRHEALAPRQPRVKRQPHASNLDHA